MWKTSIFQKEKSVAKKRRAEKGRYNRRLKYQAANAKKLQRRRCPVSTTLLAHSPFCALPPFSRYGLSRKPKATEEKDANKAAVAQSLGADEGEGEVRIPCCRSAGRVSFLPAPATPAAADAAPPTSLLSSRFAPVLLARTWRRWRRRASAAS